MKSFVTILVLSQLLAVGVAWGQTTYTWNQTAAAAYGTSTNWTPTRATPATSDVLVIDGSSTSSPVLTGVPTETIGQFKVQNGAYATLVASSAVTLTISGGIGTDFQIDAGCSLVDSGTVAITIALNTGTTGSVAGSISFIGAPHRLTSADAAGLTFQSTSIMSLNTGFTGNAFGAGTANSVVFAAGAWYIQYSGANPFALSAPSSVVVFQTGSNFKWMVSSSTPSLSGRTYSNYIQGPVTFSGSGVSHGSNCVVDSLIIEAGGTFNYNVGTASTGVLVIKGNLVKNGSFVTAPNQRIAFAGSGGLQTVRGTLDTLANGDSVAVGANVLLLTNISIATGKQHKVLGTFDPGSAQVQGLGAVNAFNGGRIKVSASTFGGNYAHAGGTTLASGSTVEYSSATAQTIDNTLSYSNLEISGGGSKSLGGNTSVGGTLTLTNGDVSTGANTLAIGSSGSVSRTSGHIIGNLNKVYSATGSKVFEVGTANGYSPVTVNATAGTGDFTVAAVQGAHPNVVDNTRSLQRYWTLTSNGITGADLTFQYLAGDVSGNEAIYQPGKYDGGWSFPAGVVNTGTHSMFVPGVTSFSDWTMGEPGALPIQLSSFTAATVAGVGVRLEWMTISEVNNYGFEVQRSATRESGYQTVSPLIPGHGTTNQKQQYSYTDNSAGAGEWFYRLKQIDLDGSVHYAEILKIGSGGVIEQAPKEFALMQNYPNPFNPATDIKFSVESTGYATMELFNAIGQRVATLFDGVAQEGQYYSVRLDASNLASGTYFYRLQSGKKTEMRKLLLLR